MQENLSPFSCCRFNHAPRESVELFGKYDEIRQEVFFKLGKADDMPEADIPRYLSRLIEIRKRNADLRHERMRSAQQIQETG